MQTYETHKTNYTTTMPQPEAHKIRGNLKHNAKISNQKLILSFNL